MKEFDIIVTLQGNTTDEDEDRIWSALTGGEPLTFLHDFNGKVTFGPGGNVKYRYAHVSVTDEPEEKKTETAEIPVISPNFRKGGRPFKLSDIKLQEIRQKLAEEPDINKAQLARDYGISYNTLVKIMRDTYK